MSKVDYRSVLTKRDILTIRRALREAIFLYSQEGAPPEVVGQRREFEALLHKVNGAKVQIVLGGIL